MISAMDRRLLLPLLLAAAGCMAVETPCDYPRDLRHPNSVKRSKAAAEFARRKDAAQLPGAFELLDDPDGQIRLLAYDTIRGMSRGGRDFGYKPWLEEPVRRGVAARWRAWWEAGQPEEALGSG